MCALQVKEMPNVLILPRSADYSEEVWMEIREQAISILQAYFLDGVVPKNAASDEDEDEEEREVSEENEQSDQLEKEMALQISIREQTDDIHICSESRKGYNQDKFSSQHQSSGLTQSTTGPSGGRRSRSGKKAKRRHARQNSRQKSEDPSIMEKENTSQREENTAMSGTDQAFSSSSWGAPPEDSRSRKTPVEYVQESTSNQLLKSNARLSGECKELLRDGYIIALYARGCSALYVSRQRVQGGDCFLELMSNVSKRDPAAQFLVIFRNKVYFEGTYFCLAYLNLNGVWLS